jgi:ATP-binding cassette subfamily F protein 3
VVHFSGGERARLALAILVAERPNLLLLDEPTNHLDFEMRHSLITALQGFAGAVIVVSHDRGLLRSVCDQFWLVADGAAADFDGDLEDYAGWLEKRAPGQKTVAGAPAAAKSRGSGRDEAGRGGKGQRGGSGKGAVRQDLAPKRQEIRTIETSLDKLGQERARLEKEIATLDFARDQAHARKVSERHAAVVREVEQLETRWLELSERLESMNG